jgi:hypothetical protein
MQIILEINHFFFQDIGLTAKENGWAHTVKYLHIGITLHILKRHDIHCNISYIKVIYLDKELNTDVKSVYLISWSHKIAHIYSEVLKNKT